MQTIQNFLQTLYLHEREFWSIKNLFLFGGLVLLFFLFRLYPIWGGNFPFQYDNAKDSLIMMEMWQQRDPALVGPTTSIPGLFYGPFWYYLALPINILFDFHPFASVLMVMILGIVNMYLFFRYLHPHAGLVYAASIGVIGTQQNAWTPYMTSLLMTPLLFLLLRFAKRSTIGYWTVGGIAVFAALFFHFQVAYAVVFLPILLLLLFIYRKKLEWQHWLLGVAIFTLSLLPSFIFELKHDFLQTRSVINFVQNYSSDAYVVNPNQQGIGRVGEIMWYILGNAQLAASPYDFGVVIGLIAVSMTAVYLYRSDVDTRVVIGGILLGTFVLYLFLPAKPYYFVALTPIWIYTVTQFFLRNFKGEIQHFSLALITLGFASMIAGRTNYLQIAQQEAILYSTKTEAISIAYFLSNGQPFSSYQFLPEVYDYAYQHIFLYKHRHEGMPLPVEFSYAPGEESYIPYKHVPQNSQQPEVVTLIVEPYFSEGVYLAWWERVTAGLEIVDERSINQTVTVYKAIPIDRNTDENPS